MHPDKNCNFLAPCCWVFQMIILVLKQSNLACEIILLLTATSWLIYILYNIQVFHFSSGLFQCDDKISWIFRSLLISFAYIQKNVKNLHYIFFYNSKIIIMGIFNEKHFILQNYRYKIQKITYKPKKNYWDKKLHIEYSELLLKLYGILFIFIQKCLQNIYFLHYFWFIHFYILSILYEAACKNKVCMQDNF